LIDNNEVETLKECLDNTFKTHGILNHSKVWYETFDTLLSVATILESETYFIKTFDVISFFEKPWKWETDMQELIDEYYEEKKSDEQ
jgi:hypothetical protein